MKDQENKSALGILSLVLWAALLTVVARLLPHRSGWNLNGILFKILLRAMQCIAIFFCWWIFTGLRLNRFIKRLNEAGYTYLRTRDVDAYLREIDICCEMSGVKNAVISGIPARDTNLIDDIPKHCCFAKAALAALNYMDRVPGIIHCHDWQDALAPVFLRTLFAGTKLTTAKAILTIRNLRYRKKGGKPRRLAVRQCGDLP